MNLWPEVRAIDPTFADTDSVALRLYVPAELDFFEGHFPGLPVLPGVVQLHWAAHFAREHLGTACKASRIDQLKFLAIVVPETELTLQLRLDRAAGLVHFAYTNASRTFSSGRISIE